MECCDVDNKQYSKVISISVYMFWKVIAHLFIIVLLLLLFKIKYVVPIVILFRC